MKILMLLVWLSGGLPQAEVRLFDNDEVCREYGTGRIKELVAKQPDIQGILAECLPIQLQSAKK